MRQMILARDLTFRTSAIGGPLQGVVEPETAFHSVPQKFAPLPVAPTMRSIMLPPVMCCRFYPIFLQQTRRLPQQQFAIGATTLPGYCSCSWRITARKWNEMPSVLHSNRRVAYEKVFGFFIMGFPYICSRCILEQNPKRC